MFTHQILLMSKKKIKGKEFTGDIYLPDNIKDVTEDRQ